MTPLIIAACWIASLLFVGRFAYQNGFSDGKHRGLSLAEEGYYVTTDRGGITWTIAKR